MKSYLKDREQIVIVNNIVGGTFVINIGVGQGTVLGPTLFKIYIMDLHLHTKLFCVKFADDSSLEATAKTRDSVEHLANTEMEHVYNWFRDNKLTLHPGKSRYMVHSRDKLIKIKINGVEIQRCGYGLQEESVKLLGVKIDENLDWKEHIREVCKKVSKGNYLLWRHRKKLTLATKKLIYESFVRSHVLYCLSVWGKAKNTNLKPLNQVLRRSWKKIDPKKEHTLTKLKRLGILTLEDELATQEGKIVWKWSKHQCPKGISTLIKEKNDRLRGRRFIRHRNSKPDSIMSRLAVRAERVIDSISHCRTRKSATSHLRNELFTSKYSTRCTVRNCNICTQT
jgi:hypothetical protein